MTQGIVTLHDIFEALVGSIPEEREEPDIVHREDGSCLIDGQCPFYDFLVCYGLEDVYPNNLYNTLSGLIPVSYTHLDERTVVRLGGIVGLREEIVADGNGLLHHFENLLFLRRLEADRHIAVENHLFQTVVDLLFQVP